MEKHSLLGTIGNTPRRCRTTVIAIRSKHLPLGFSAIHSLLVMTFLFILSFLFTSNLSAQTITRQLVGGASGTAEQGTMRLSWSLGEVAVGHWQGKDGSRITEGFQQPNLELMLTQLKKEALVSVAPNPVRDLLNITVLDAQDDNLKMTLTDQQGRTLIRKSSIGLWRNELDMSPYPAGMYFLKVHQGLRGTVQTYKVVKIQ